MVKYQDMNKTLFPIKLGVFQEVFYFSNVHFIYNRSFNIIQFSLITIVLHNSHNRQNFHFLAIEISIFFSILYESRMKNSFNRN